MIEYQTVVLDRCKVMQFKGGIWPTWVTQHSGASALAFWSKEKPVYHADGVWRGDSSLVYCDTAEDCDEVWDVFRDLPDEQRIARIRYRLTPEPYSEDEPTPDPVNNPAHYRQGEIECIDAIRSALAPEKSALTPEEFRGFCKGNALKYIWREKHKGGDESIRKAVWYLQKILGVEVLPGAPDPEAVERLIEAVTGYFDNSAPHTLSDVTSALGAVRQSRK